MVKEVEGDILKTDAQFIVCQCDIQGNVGTYGLERIESIYPHVGIEYRKYLQFCKKNLKDYIGTCQYVPVEAWALPLIDTMRNDNIFEYDNESFQYFVNAVVEDVDSGIKFKNVEKAIKNISHWASKLNVTTAIPYRFGTTFRDKKWNAVREMIEKEFSSDVIIYKRRRSNGY